LRQDGTRYIAKSNGSNAESGETRFGNVVRNKSKRSSHENLNAVQTFADSADRILSAGRIPLGVRSEAEVLRYATRQLVARCLLSPDMDALSFCSHNSYEEGAGSLIPAVRPAGWPGHDRCSLY
jgi:hypothetical protein